MYKKQVQELHENLLTQEMRVKKSEYENKRSEERMIVIHHEKERLLNELNMLKETNEELQIMNVISTSNKNETVVSDVEKVIHDLNMFSELELLSLPIELKFVFYFSFFLIF
jgi:hypothetical protein